MENLKVKLVDDKAWLQSEVGNKGSWEIKEVESQLKLYIYMLMNEYDKSTLKRHRY